MSEAKVEIKVGQIEFSGEGEQKWVAEQLDKILTKAEGLIVVAPPTEQAPVEPQHKPMAKDPAIAGKTLPSFLGEKTASKNQVKKFLATAIWLEAKGKKRLATKEVAQALKASNQARLSNPANCLNRNVSKGYCEKDGQEFFVTQEGKKSL